MHIAFRTPFPILNHALSNLASINHLKLHRSNTCVSSLFIHTLKRHPPLFRYPHLLDFFFTLVAFIYSAAWFECSFVSTTHKVVHHPCVGHSLLFLSQPSSYIHMFHFAYQRFNKYKCPSFRSIARMNRLTRYIILLNKR